MNPLPVEAKLTVEQCRDILRDKLKMPQPVGFGTRAWFEVPLSLTEGTTHWVLQTVGSRDRYEVHVEKDNFAISPTTDQMMAFAIAKAEERWPGCCIMSCCRSDQYLFESGRQFAYWIKEVSDVKEVFAASPSAALFALIEKIMKEESGNGK